MVVSNRAKSVLDRLKNQSKQTNLSFQASLQLFAQEEFLRKLSLSDYNNKFILKGGMFIYTLTNYESRPTKDVDFILRNSSNKLDDIERTIKNICAVKTGNDFILIKFMRISQIGKQKEYPGARVSLLATIGKVRIPFSIDIGINDIVVPEPTKSVITTRLKNFTSPEIYTYSLESTIAEKLDAILERMSATSRMKDFFDIYYLSNTFDFDGKTLHIAIMSTTKHRNRTMPNDAFDDIRSFASNPYLLKQWSNFDPAKETELPFAIVIDEICNFLEPVYSAAVNNTNFSKQWSFEDNCWT